MNNPLTWPEAAVMIAWLAFWAYIGYLGTRKDTDE